MQGWKWDVIRHYLVGYKPYYHVFSVNQDTGMSRVQVEFQCDGRPSSETGSSYISVVD